MAIDTNTSYEDIELSLSNYTELESYIQNAFIKPKTLIRNDSEEFQDSITKIMIYIDKIIKYIDHMEKEENDEEGAPNSVNIVKLKYYNMYYFKHCLAMKRQAVVKTDDKEELKKLQEHEEPLLEQSF
ncbi:unnamed protein product [Hanseniaspora opuntiae]